MGEGRRGPVLALGSGSLADAPVLRLFQTLAHTQDERLHRTADTLHDAQPRDAEEERKPDRERGEEQQRAAVVTEAAAEDASERTAERAAGTQGQRAQLPRAQRLARSAARAGTGGRRGAPARP